MPRQFNVPEIYRSSVIYDLKEARAQTSANTQDYSPLLLDYGKVRFSLACHFGFCFGVKNALEKIYRIVQENQGRRVYLISEIIHNPGVNEDLLKRGVSFLLKPDGTRLVDFSLLMQDDIVVIPAFGVTVELEQELAELGIDTRHYDTTCPFVKNVWHRATYLGEQGYTVIIHGKRMHEETRATYSHSVVHAPTLVVRDLAEAQYVCATIAGRHTAEEFTQRFSESFSSGFAAAKHLEKVGIVNQTTMRASETHAIAELFEQTMSQVYGAEDLREHFADTRDTLCYATYENQRATQALTKYGADLAVVVGGYNSSNTANLAQVCRTCLPTYLIKNENELLDPQTIRHFDLDSRTVILSSDWLPRDKEKPVEVAITAGASCPDSTVDAVIRRIAGFFPDTAHKSKFGP
jgi:4-hydroxy-3-methylbut-2-en-1-yl diphosphate reductase